EVTASVAGPKRPQDRISLQDVGRSFRTALTTPAGNQGYGLSTEDVAKSAEVELPEGGTHQLKHGDVAIAAITSCTNTSNPSVLLAAGLLARKAYERGLTRKPWVKTSFAPGSMVVTEYLQRTGLMEFLEKQGFYLVGYGCTTCIGNSGPLPEPIARGVESSNLVVAGVLSGNRNFEGRINPHTKANYLMSPPLVVAYAVAGTVDIDLANQAIGTDRAGEPVYLHEIWPTAEELRDLVRQALDRDSFIKSYSNLEDANPEWNQIELTDSDIYDWKGESTYIQEPPFFTEMDLATNKIEPISEARCLVMAGDSTTTDHISPAGPIDPKSPAGQYLLEHGVPKEKFNSYGSRRGNDRIMTRGTFANIRFRNKIAPGTEGSFTTYWPTSEVISIFDAAERYKKEGTPTVVLAGKDYGMGSSRDWAAKGTQLLGIRAVIAESFERIHRSNLVGMGVLPLQFSAGESYESLGLTGKEVFSIPVDESVSPKTTITVEARDPQSGSVKSFDVICRLDSPVEIQYYRNGGILQTVLRKFVA
ncbi:MAG: aconitate hydratase, partial [Alkalispirochaetaceae bacterium]